MTQTPTNYEPPPGIYSHILRKARRATRNETGIALSYDEVVALLHSEVYTILAEAERQELLTMHFDRVSPQD